MSREQILNILTTHGPQLKSDYGFSKLAIFGSAARDELSAKSDVDILVEFDDSPTYDGYMDLKFRLEALLELPVDLVTRRAIKPRMLPFIEQELINAT